MTNSWGPTSLISADQIEKYVGVADAHSVTEEVLRGLALGRVEMPAKVTMNLANYGLNAWNTAMPAYIESPESIRLQVGRRLFRQPGKARSAVSDRDDPRPEFLYVCPALTPEPASPAKAQPLVASTPLHTKGVTHGHDRITPYPHLATRHRGPHRL